ncbi:hypothetical protein LK994_02610 [Ferruginibacter lapsinanis]|uniref:hypothetical protein n=1 Tax=Ferruginibacter lapsinanis TaxID=563172 RepID=UPI001E5D3DE0|nr:hypothetical protein [Ferruginibacter lapsinanis]UEG50366.1 hypothetical protein LK994_02610 [Ferruginibacter lapsinanis]
MKYKHILSLFLVGVIVYLIGVVFKITHAPHANTIIIVAVATMITAVILAIIKILTTKNNSFLNK